VPEVHTGPPLTANNVNNPSYRHVVERLFDIAGGPDTLAPGPAPATQAQSMMWVGGGVRPVNAEWLDETAFNMSYVGDTGGANVRVPRHHVWPALLPALQYQTSGADLNNTGVQWNQANGVISGVPPCFLGLYGCQRSPLGPP